MRRVLLLALLLVCIVVPLGAYVRLSDAGLGCPDWPGCYGRLSPLHAAPLIQEQHAANPDGPVSMAKAWKEMSHRYLAASLGLLLLALNVLAWRQRRLRGWAALLLLLVCVQGALGMWTVTLLLKPAIVSAHLLGGMTLAALLATCCWWQRRLPQHHAVGAASFALALLLPLLLLLQIALGGWVSSNYAALACQGFPACNGEWWPAGQWHGAFHLLRELGEGPDGAPLLSRHLLTIHWVHRLGAALVSLLLLWLVLRLWRQPPLRPLLCLLLGSWLLQLSLGIGNVLLQLPLALAVAHNAGAMLLLIVATLLLLSLDPAPRRIR
ncbi:COX15/CtaA family protein [Vogesella indigofera]|uniref:COX15/CtaA family protein n=1 Tax=Vogesella indigofera TaxID=45465 RepID=UPI003F423863